MITSFEIARREIANLTADAKLIPPDEITPLLTTFIPRMLGVLDFLIAHAESDLKVNNCKKCGAAMQQRNDGDLGCQRCEVEELLSHYKQDDHEDALSRMVSELEHSKDATMKRYSVEDVLTHPGEEAQTNLAMFGPGASPDDYVTIASSLKDAPGTFHYMTGVPFNWTQADDDTKRMQTHWGKHKKDAKHITRRFAMSLLGDLHRLYGRAPGSFSIIELQPEGTRVSVVPATPMKYAFNLDRDKFTVEKSFMTGADIKSLLKNDAKQKYALFIEEPDTGPDRQVRDDEGVHIEGLVMYTVPPAEFGSGQEEAKQETVKLLGEAIDVSVNSDQETLYFKDGEPREITYEQIIRIACDQIDKSKGRPVKPPGYDQFPQMSVTYRHKVAFEQLPGEREGSLWKGKKVAVTPGMIINAYCT